jgi:hypothetical protein
MWRRIKDKVKEKERRGSVVEALVAHSVQSGKAVNLTFNMTPAVPDPPRRETPAPVYTAKESLPSDPAKLEIDSFGSAKDHRRLPHPASEHASHAVRPFADQPVEGLRVVYESSDKNYIVADIVFIHGLTGGTKTTWFDSPSGVYWPSDLLAKDVPRTRILAFDYDADVTRLLGPVSQNNLRGYAEALLSDLASLRESTNSVWDSRCRNIAN